MQMSQVNTMACSTAHPNRVLNKRNKGYYPNLHGWDFSIPPSPKNPTIVDISAMAKAICTAAVHLMFIWLFARRTVEGAIAAV